MEKRCGNCVFWGNGYCRVLRRITASENRCRHYAARSNTGWSPTPLRSMTAMIW